MDPRIVIDILGACEYRPDADHFYDMLRGGLVWDDELPDREHDHTNFMRSILLLAEVIAYRASLTLGEPNSNFEPKWYELREILPSWPGFRDERIHGEVERELRIIKRREERCLDRFEAELDADGT